MKLQPVILHSTAPGIRAFSLIEALVSACIVGVLFVSLYAGITAGFGALNSAAQFLFCKLIEHQTEGGFWFSMLR